MKSLYCALSVLSILALAAPAQAGALETQTVAGVGTATAGIANVGRSTGLGLATPWLSQTLRVPNYSGVGLEVNTVPNRGLGASLAIDLLRLEPVRLHVDLGVFWNLGTPVSVADLKRTYDLTLGAGLDVLISQHWGVMASWRSYLPEPGSFLRYGDLAVPAYKAALKGGQASLGALFRW